MNMTRTTEVEKTEELREQLGYEAHTLIALGKAGAAGLMLVAVEVVHRQAEALDRYWESRNTAPVAPARARRGAAATAEATPTAPAATKHRHMYGPAGTCVRSGCTQVKRGPGRPTADEAPSLGLPGTDAPDAAAPEEV